MPIRVITSRPATSSQSEGEPEGAHLPAPVRRQPGAAHAVTGQEIDDHGDDRRPAKNKGADNGGRAQYPDSADKACRPYITWHQARGPSRLSSPPAELPRLRSSSLLHCRYNRGSATPRGMRPVVAELQPQCLPKRVDAGFTALSMEIGRPHSRLVSPATCWSRRCPFCSPDRPPVKRNRGNQWAYSRQSAYHARHRRESSGPRSPPARNARPHPRR
jgi:hypothetical protein